MLHRSLKGDDWRRAYPSAPFTRLKPTVEDVEAGRYKLIILLTAILGGLILFAAAKRPGRTPVQSSSTVAGQAAVFETVDHDHWFNIHLQNRKIGYANIRSFAERDGILLVESIFMRDAVLGDMVQNYQQKTEAFLNLDYSLRSFEYENHSGNASFSSSGRFNDGVLDLVVMSAGTTTRRKIPAGGRIYLPPAVVPALTRLNLGPGETYTLPVFNPMDMRVSSASVILEGRAPVAVMGANRDAVRISIRSRLGFIQAWIDDNGGVWSMITGDDVRQTRTTRYNALFDVPADEGSRTRPPVLASDRPLPYPPVLERLTVMMNGPLDMFPDISGGRQRLEGDRLIIEKESLEELPQTGDRLLGPEVVDVLMAETMYIQSGIPEIQHAAALIASSTDPPLERVRKIVSWVSRYLGKKAGPSGRGRDGGFRSGDFHEHAIMTAALARAAGFPAHLETGLVYRDNAFHYHAWNRIYIGRWITCDAFLDQIPADVSHIRLASGIRVFQADMFNRIRNLKIEVQDYE